jgi:hypothetical protein
MKSEFLRNLLLIEEPSVFRLYQEMTQISMMLIGPLFLLAVIFEFLGEMQFVEVLKKLFLISIFITFFYQLHSKAVDVSLRTASETLTRVSPDNIFTKRWTEGRIKTPKDESWSWAKSFALPNVNEMIGTTLFVLAQVLLWILKLIYSTVYHLTYVFSGITAVLYFLGWTKDALKGTVQASIWCVLLPFVVIAILALVGNTLNDNVQGTGLAVGSIDSLIWLFGITLLLITTPFMTLGMVKGDGVHAFGAKVATLTTLAAKNMAFSYPSQVLNAYSNTKSGLVKSYRFGNRSYGKAKNFLQKKGDVSQTKQGANSSSVIAPKTSKNVSAPTTVRSHSSHRERTNPKHSGTSLTAQAKVQRPTQSESRVNNRTSSQEKLQKNHQRTQVARSTLQKQTQSQLKVRETKNFRTENRQNKSVVTKQTSKQSKTPAIRRRRHELH